MVQLKVIAGRRAGQQVDLNRFPLRVGRSGRLPCQIDDDGVWEEHFEIDLDSATGFHLTSLRGAISLVNGQPVKSVLLHNGDLIEVGGAKIRFWLAATRQRSLRLREWLTWLGFAALTGGQLYLIYQLAL